MGQTAYQQMLDNKDREERRDRERREFAWKEAEQARLAEARAREDAAFAELTNTQMGLQPATAAKITETYGMTPQQIAAAGAGLKQKLAEYDVPDSWDLQGGVAGPPSGDVAGAAARPPEALGLVPRRFTADQVELVAPSQLDMERALGRVAIARRDTAGIRASLDKQQALELDRKRKEYLKRLENMSPEALAKELGGMFSADGSGVEAMLTWAPDKKQFLWASNIPGFPSRTLTRAELIKGAMGIWELGNGDYNTGMQAVLDTVKAQRDLRNADRAESIALAKNAAEMDFKNRELESADRYRRGILGRHAASQARSEAAAKLENDINGVLEGYQAAMAAGPQGRDAAAIYAREYDQLRAVAAQRGLKVPPTLQALQAAQKNGPPMKPIKVDDAGQAYLVPQADGSQRLMYSDGRGGYIGENGVLPSDRAAVLAQAGVPQALIPNIVWSDDGTTVLYRGREYALNELEQLARDAVRLGANDRRVEELQKLPHGTRPTDGLGPRITFAPDPRAPSIYARPEEWAAYRAQQGR